MAKAAKKRGKKKAAKTTKRKPKAKKSGKKSVKRTPAKRKPAKRKPAKRAPAKRAPAPQTEPWPMIFAVLFAVAGALIAGWYANGVAEAAAVFGYFPVPAEAATIAFGGTGECSAAGSWIASFAGHAPPIAN